MTVRDAGCPLLESFYTVHHYLGGRTVSYRLGVDLGTTFTAAASIADGEQPTMVGLGNRSLQIPSVLFIQADDITLVGEPAERRGLEDPARVVREFKRRLGDHTPILVGDASYSAESLSARLLQWVVMTAAERMGGPAESVMLTHPANWGPHRLGLLEQAAAMAGVDHASRCTEPEAAAAQYAARAQLAVGDRVAVYDLGGGTFDVCILEKIDRGFVLLGSPGGLEHLGGVDFDEAVFRHVWDSLNQRRDFDPADPSVGLALARLRRECVDAKEALSTDTEVAVPVALPGLTTTVRMTRAELEMMIRPAVLESVASIRHTMRSASVKPEDLSTVILVGGSSRIPLVGEILQTTLGVRTALDLHPKHDVALGAARLAQLAGSLADVRTPTSPRSPELTTLPRQRSDPASLAPRSSSARSQAAGTSNGTPAVESSETEEQGDRSLVPGLVDRRTAALIAAVTAVLVALLVLGVRTLLLGQDHPQSSDMPSTSGPPTVEKSTETSTPSVPAALEPLDEGSHKWASGVRLTMSIRLVERWGVRYPYCEDGSCGFAEPNDLRVVLDYSVKVPKTLQKGLDAAACPGALHASDPTTLVRPVTNAYRERIKKTIKAGTTETGVVEYSIPKAARSDSFEILSHCGEVGTTGDVRKFRGKFPPPRKAEVPLDAGDKPLKRWFFSLRVAEVRTDIGSRRYAVLVERCVRRKLPSGYRADPPSPLSSWRLLTDKGVALADARWKALLPRFPYGGFRKGDCTSGWMAFDIKAGAEIDSLVHQDPVLGDWTSWKLGKGVRRASTPQPPSTQTTQTTQPRPQRPSSDPSRESRRPRPPTPTSAPEPPIPSPTPS